MDYKKHIGKRRTKIIYARTHQQNKESARALLWQLCGWCLIRHSADSSQVFDRNTLEMIQLSDQKMLIIDFDKFLYAFNRLLIGLITFRSLPWNYRKTFQNPQKNFQTCSKSLPTNLPKIPPNLPTTSNRTFPKIENIKYLFRGVVWFCTMLYVSILAGFR